MGGVARVLSFMRSILFRRRKLAAQNAELTARVKALTSDSALLLARLGAAEQELRMTKAPQQWPTVGPFLPKPDQLPLSALERRLIDQFHDLYYRLGQRGFFTYHVSWLGYSTLKCPLDLWIYQELICRIKPDVIIETGTASGGSALYLATLCQLVGHGEVITIDVDARDIEVRPMSPRLSYISGSSTDPEVFAEAQRRVAGRPSVMVILDSDHRKAHVLEELRLYHQFVPVGGYLIVEDTNINGHPTYPEFGPGPMEAVEEFLTENGSFREDESCERFLLTMNPRGFLLRER